MWRSLLFPVVAVMIVVMVAGYCCVVAAYRQSPTRKYLLAWLSSEPGLSACGILYRTRGFPHSRSMRERTNKKREIVSSFFSAAKENGGIKDRAAQGEGGDAVAVCAEGGGGLFKSREVDGVIS